jgi:hypothetical protein
MATKYQATAKHKCWKKHICLGCGSAFRYHFERSTTGTDSRSKRDAAEAAERNLDRKLRDEVDLEPCPACGLYQPDMVGSTRGCSHQVITIGAAIVAAPWLILGLIGVAGLTEVIGLWIAFALSVIAFLLQFLMARKNPNSDPVANVALCQEKLKSGKMQLLRKLGTPGCAPAPWSKGPSRVQWIVLILLGLSTLVLPSAEYLRLAARWPYNAHWSPGVVGPGDHPRFYLDGEIKSVKGLWKGKATARVINAEELGLANVELLAATTKNDSWGKMIFGKSTSARSETPWVEIAIPDRPDLADKELRIQIHLDTEYPADVKGGFIEEEKSFEQPATVKLASMPMAGSSYQGLYLVMGIGGVVMNLLLGLWLGATGRAISKLALPSETQEFEEDDDIEEVKAAEE